jgi:lysine biosynthesis protein LysW
MTIAFCPECEHRLKLGTRPRMGQRVTCPECEVKLEVVSLNPLELDAYILETSNAKKRTVAEVFCSECGHLLKLGTRPREGQQVICPECKTNLEVVSLSPLELEISMTSWKRK